MPQVQEVTIPSAEVFDTALEQNVAFVYFAPQLQQLFVAEENSCILRVFNHYCRPMVNIVV